MDKNQRKLWLKLGRLSPIAILGEAMLQLWSSPLEPMPTSSICSAASYKVKDEG